MSKSLINFNSKLHKFKINMHNMRDLIEVFKEFM